MSALADREKNCSQVPISWGSSMWAHIGQENLRVWSYQWFLFGLSLCLGFFPADEVWFDDLGDFSLDSFGLSEDLLSGESDKWSE